MSAEHAGPWFAGFDPGDDQEDAPPITPWVQANADGVVDLPDALGPVALIGQADAPGGPVISWRTATRGTST